MTVHVETLEKLERKMTLSLPVGSIQAEVQTRLRKLARTVKMDGFRPGKVPMNVVSQRYGYTVQYEVMNDKVGQAFSDAANQANLRVAGQPRITEKEGSPAGELSFDAVFEVFPEVRLGALADAEVEKISAEVDDGAVNRTLDILRKQRRTFAQRPQDAQAQLGDRATVDFEGKIDGEPFDGGKAEAFGFILGDGQMLAEFEAATVGMQSGQSKTFQLSFPADYHGKDVAGKTADFMLTVKKIEAAHLPELNSALAASLNVAEPTVEGLRADIRKNLQRELANRLRMRNKQAAIAALVSKAELDLPKASVQAEIQRLLEAARADLKQRGVKDAEKASIPEDIFRPQAESRVRTGLVVAELVRAHKLHAKPEQVKAHVEELAASYEKPGDLLRYYYSDKQRMAEVEGLVMENNVTDYVLAQAKITEKSISFEEMMASN